MRVEIDGWIEDETNLNVKVCGKWGNKAGANEIGEGRRWSGSWPAIGLEMAVMERLKRLPQQNNESKFFLNTHNPRRVIAGRFESTSMSTTRSARHAST